MTTRFGCGLHHSLLRPYKSTLTQHLKGTKPSISIQFITKTALLHRTNTTTAVRINHNTRVNGPVSTLPAPLVLPTRAPDESFISFAFKRGKGCKSLLLPIPSTPSSPTPPTQPKLTSPCKIDLQFYKTGLKNVYANHILARPLRSLPTSSLTRSNFQLLHRSSHDVRRIPLFLLVFIICGEFTPFVVLFLSGVVPNTCKIPSQISKEREKLELRRKNSFRNLDTNLPAPPKSSSSASEHEKGNGKVEALNRHQLLHISNSLNLSSPLWPEALGLPPDSILRSRIRKRAEYLSTDDTLITRDGGVSQMEMEEVRRACEERGIDVLGRNDEILRGTLRKWMDARKTSSIEKLLLTRPSVWALKGS